MSRAKGPEIGDSELLERIDGLTRALEASRRSNVGISSPQEVGPSVERTPPSAELEIIWLVEADGTTRDVSACVSDLVGIDRSELIGRKAIELAVPEDHAWLTREHARIVGDPTVARALRYRVRHRDGSIRWVEAVATNLLDDPSVGAIVGTVRDITERRRHEEARARLAAIVELSDDAILSRDVDGTIRTWNRGAEKLFQYTAEEAVGRPISILTPSEHELDLRARRLAVNEGTRIEDIELDIEKKDGTRALAMVRVTPLSDPSGIVTGAAIIVRDITEQRRAQEVLAQTEAQLRQVQKLEAVGSLAGGIAHDFNNMLSVVLTYTELALEHVPADQPLHSDLLQIEKAAERAADLVRQLLAFSRQLVLQPQLVDLNGCVRDIEKILKRVLGEAITFAFSPGTDVGKVFTDPGEIERVLLNLVVNARDAMPDGGRLIIETDNVEFDEAYVRSHAGTRVGSYVRLSVSDSGVGMSAETQARIFEPFFSTKESGKGTGLGLSTVFGIIAQCGGFIWVYSELDMGTTFKVYLPTTNAEGPASTDTPHTPDIRGGTETILVVENEDAVRAGICRSLRERGYHVLDAHNGGEALLICEQHHAPIHLLLTDVVMPRMSGTQLAARLAPLRTDMKVLYMSGYTDRTIAQHGMLDVGLAFLEKPITPSALARRVREVLDGKVPERRRLRDE